MTATPRTRRNQGATMVELAFTLPVVVMLLFAMIDFGFYFQSSFAARNAARIGARVASNFHPNCNPTDLANEVEAAVDRVMLAAALPDVQTVQVSYPFGASSLCGNQPDGLVSVEISFPYRLQLLGNLFAGLLFDPNVNMKATDLQRDFN